MYQLLIIDYSKKTKLSFCNNDIITIYHQVIKYFNNNYGPLNSKNNVYLYSNFINKINIYDIKQKLIEKKNIREYIQSVICGLDLNYDFIINPKDKPLYLTTSLSDLSNYKDEILKLSDLTCRLCDAWSLIINSKDFDENIKCEYFKKNHEEIYKIMRYKVIIFLEYYIDLFNYKNGQLYLSEMASKTYKCREIITNIINNLLVDGRDIYFEIQEINI